MGTSHSAIYKVSSHLALSKVRNGLVVHTAMILLRLFRFCLEQLSSFLKYSTLERLQARAAGIVLKESNYKRELLELF